jgi:hypothetical protein
MIRIEKKDIPVRKIQWVAFSLVVLLLLIGIALWAYQNHMVQNFQSTESWPRVTPREQAEFESGRIREQQQTEQRQHLQTYQGLKDSSPWVQVPIDRAMQYLLDRKSTDPKIIFSQSPGGTK